MGSTNRPSYWEILKALKMSRQKNYLSWLRVSLRAVMCSSLMATSYSVYAEDAVQQEVAQENFEPGGIYTEPELEPFAQMGAMVGGDIRGLAANGLEQ